MGNQSRRDFISNTGKATIMGGLGLAAAPAADAGKLEKSFIHHVFFWLKNPSSEEDKKQLIEGLRKLTKAKTISSWHIGVPADTHRDVIERSYQVSWMLLFKSDADQAAYQIDPVHLKFVEECSHLWEKVIVYDSVQA
ncbi:MAG TPA: Dabb family protein [Flavihumibacter sp.]|jgi:hypothetical protein